MTRLGFKMVLHPGKAEEYKQRHDHIWPELIRLLKGSGISDYVIFLDEETHVLYASLKIDHPQQLDDLPQHPVMRRWWSYMADIMATQTDHSPLSVPLKEMFYLE